MCLQTGKSTDKSTLYIAPADFTAPCQKCQVPQQLFETDRTCRAMGPWARPLEVSADWCWLEADRCWNKRLKGEKLQVMCFVGTQKGGGNSFRSAGRWMPTLVVSNIQPLTRSATGDHIQDCSIFVQTMVDSDIEYPASDYETCIAL